MRSPRPRVLLLAVALVPAAAAWETARAEEASFPIRIDADGPDGCVTNTGFLSQIEARDPRIRPSAPGERAPLVVARVTRPPRGVAHGKLSIEEVDGTVARREVDGDTCESVTGALALMAVLAVDPNAPLPLPPSTHGEGDAVAGIASSTPGAASDGGIPSTSSSDAAAATADGEADEGTSREDPGPPGTSLDVSAGGGVGTGATPDVVPTILASLMLAFERARVYPVIGAGFEHANSGDEVVSAASGRASQYVLNAGTLDGCAGIALGRRLRLLPCAEIEGGALSASGVDIKPARSETNPWLALGAVGRLRLGVVSVLFVELSLGARFPLLRDRYYFEPNTNLFRPPAVGALAGLTVGLKIP